MVPTYLINITQYRPRPVDKTDFRSSFDLLVSSSSTSFSVLLAACWLCIGLGLSFSGMTLPLPLPLGVVADPSLTSHVVPTNLNEIYHYVLTQWHDISHRGIDAASVGCIMYMYMYM